MTQRRYELNRSDFTRAKRIRETFVDRDMEKKIKIRWKWPKRMLCVGQNEAVLYRSDKWQDKGKFTDYKHVAEGPQLLYIKEGFIRDYHSPDRPLDLPGEWVELPRDMPESIAELAPVLGVQFQPYAERDDDKLVLSDKFMAVKIARAYVGAAELPTGEVFLLIYTPTELCAIITGDILNVEKDGIVG